MVQLGKSVKYNDDCEVTRYREKFIGKATIVIKEFHPDDKSAALYAWGIAICGPRETFDENEGTRRANGRADWVINRYESGVVILVFIKKDTVTSIIGNCSKRIN